MKITCEVSIRVTGTRRFLQHLLIEKYGWKDERFSDTFE